MPTVELLAESGERRTVQLRVLRSYYEMTPQEIFHVHPEFVDVDPDTAASSVHLCEGCCRAAFSKTGMAPKGSIAAGCDYGLLTRLGLEPPSAFETLLLADVRTYSLTVKVHVPGQWCAARQILRGHMIAFVHDGPQIVYKHFDKAPWTSRKSISKRLADCRRSHPEACAKPSAL